MARSEQLCHDTGVVGTHGSVVEGVQSAFLCATDQVTEIYGYPFLPTQSSPRICDTLSKIKGIHGVIQFLTVCFVKDRFPEKTLVLSSGEEFSSGHSSDLGGHRSNIFRETQHSGFHDHERVVLEGPP